MQADESDEGWDTDDDDDEDDGPAVVESGSAASSVPAPSDGTAPEGAGQQAEAPKRRWKRESHSLDTRRAQLYDRRDSFATWSRAVQHRGPVGIRFRGGWQMLVHSWLWAENLVCSLPWFCAVQSGRGPSSAYPLQPPSSPLSESSSPDRPLVPTPLYLII